MKTTCGVFVIDNNNNILAAHPTRHGATQWDIIKGMEDVFDEDELITVHREFKEETGLNLSDLDIREIVDISETHGTFVYPNKKKQLYAFAVFLNDSIEISTLKCDSMVENFKVKGEVIPPFPEIDAFAWINSSEIGLLHITQQAAIKKINYISDHKYDTNKSSQFFIINKSNLYG